MTNIKTIEKNFRILIKNLNKLPQENFVKIDLEFLQKHDLLHFQEKSFIDNGLTRYFQVIESLEKITLINEEFIVWIVPENIDNKNVTYTIIALNDGNDAKLELVFLLSGAYNSSSLVLGVLDKILSEIEETEEMMKNMS